MLQQLSTLFFYGNSECCVDSLRNLTQFLNVWQDFKVANLNGLSFTQELKSLHMSFNELTPNTNLNLMPVVLIHIFQYAFRTGFHPIVQHGVIQRRKILNYKNSFLSFNNLLSVHIHKLLDELAARMLLLAILCKFTQFISSSQQFVHFLAYCGAF